MQDIGPVLNPESARSSITIHSWTLFKKARQSQVLPSRYQRQPRRPTPFVPRCKKPLHHRTDTDSGRSLPHTSKQASREGAVPFFSLSTYLLMNYVTIETMLFAGLSNVRAPLDVVLGGGYMGPGPDTIAHLLLPVGELISLSLLSFLAYYLPGCGIIILMVTFFRMNCLPLVICTPQRTLFSIWTPVLHHQR